MVVWSKASLISGLPETTHQTEVEDKTLYTINMQIHHNTQLSVL